MEQHTAVGRQAPKQFGIACQPRPGEGHRKRGRATSEPNGRRSGASSPPKVCIGMPRLPLQFFTACGQDCAAIPFELLFVGQDGAQSNPRLAPAALFARVHVATDSRRGTRSSARSPGAPIWPLLRSKAAGKDVLWAGAAWRRNVSPRCVGAWVACTSKTGELLLSRLCYSFSRACG
jgi:hypothetical protein